MIDGKRILAVIPARGGSKRLPGKNILELAGKPLIGWTIEAALSSDYVDRVVVSTECHQIAAVAKKLGADVPFYRPISLSGDETTTIKVILHVLEELADVGENYDYVMLLQPTSPLRSCDHINNACRELIDSEKADSVVSVCLAEHHPLWSNVLPEDNSLSFFLNKDIENVRSQDLPPYYRLNGAIYISDVKSIVRQETFFLKDACFAFLMSQADSIDIDTSEDFNHAQLTLDSLTMKRAKMFLKIYETFSDNSGENLSYEKFSQHILGLINE